MKKTVLQLMFGSSPRLKLMEFFLENDRTEWPISELPKQTSMNYNTIRKLIPKMEKDGLLVKTMRGSFKYYSLNKENKIVKKFLDLYQELLKSVAKEFK